MVSLRERKRSRTRRALITAAARLFERRGYGQTTIADIASAAGVSPRTFFGYFDSKEDVLFPDADARVRLALNVIDARGPDESPVGTLLRALREVSEGENDDMVSRTAAVRPGLIRSVPSVRARALQLQYEAQTAIAQRLHAAYPDQLDEVEAAALVGAFAGAAAAALDVLLSRSDADPDSTQERVLRATAVALQSWPSKRRLDQADPK